MDAHPPEGLGLGRKQATERMLLTFQLNELQGYRVTVMVWQHCNEFSWHPLGNAWFPERGEQIAGGMKKLI